MKLLPLALVVSTLPLRASTIEWGAVQETTGDVSEVSNAGSAFAARNVNGSATQTINGVAFATTSIGWGQGAYNTGLNGTTTGNTGYDDLLNRAMGGGPASTSSPNYPATTSNPSPVVAVRLDSLNTAGYTVGHTYQIQVWFTDQRPGSGVNLKDRRMQLNSTDTTATLTMSSGYVSVLEIPDLTGGGSIPADTIGTPSGYLEADPDNLSGSGSGDTKLGSFAIGTWVADSKPIYLLIEGSHPDPLVVLRPATNGFAIRDVTPASVWNGGDLDDDKWSSGDNWEALAPAAADSILRFGSSAQSTSTNDLPANTAFVGLEFTAAATNALTLSGNAVALNGPIDVLAPNTTHAIALPLGLASMQRINVASTAGLEIGGVIGGDGGIDKQGSGTLVLTGDNTFTGAASVSAGVLRIAHDSAFGDTLLVTLANTGAIVELANGIDVSKPATISNTGNTKTIQLQAGAASATWSGDISIAETTGGYCVAAVPDAASTMTFSGVISGAVGTTGIYKTGGGTLRLSNPSNTYAGATNVTAGTLQGTGSSTSALTVQAGATLAPGSAIGTFKSSAATFSASVSIASTLAIQIDSSGTPVGDLLDVAGNLSLSSTGLGVVLSLADLAASPVALAANTQLTIIQYTGTRTGAFRDLAEGDRIVLGPNTFTIHYDDSAKTVFLTANATVGGFVSWATTHITDINPAAPAGFDDDADNDGIDNGLEWVLGGNPLAGDPSVLPDMTGSAGGGLTLVFDRNPESIGTSTLAVEWDTDLTGGFAHSITVGGADVPPSGSNPSVDIDAPSVGKVTVNIPAANASGGRILARLKASLP